MLIETLDASVQSPHLMDYDTQRLHSAIVYVTPQNKLEGRETLIFAEHNRKLAQASDARARRRQPVHSERLSGSLPDGQAVGTAYAA